MEYQGHTLDDFQVRAVQAVDRGESVLVSAPTGAGKTLIAEYALEKCLNEGKRIIYTAPIKALSNQKFRDFTVTYGDRVGLVTGDVVINPHAQALIMTTEILRNTIFDDPERLSDVQFAIFDEIHFMDDRERGTVWEESIIFAPEHIRVLGLSATVANLNDFASWIRKTRKGKLEVILETGRPVPLKHLLVIHGHGIGNLKDLRRLEDEAGTPAGGHGPGWHRATEPEDRRDDGREPRRVGPHNWRRFLMDHIQKESQLPLIWFIFNRRECEERAQEAMHREFLNASEREIIARLFDEWATKYGVEADKAVVEMRRLVLRGIAFHHAGLLPTLKDIVERIFTAGLIKLIFTTETFALGINMPARTVVFDSMTKFDGIRRNFLLAREYMQMAGRAGRRGMDAVGYVYSNVEWPYVRFGAIDRVIEGEIEPIRSQFNLSYATLLNLWQRLGKNIFKACENSFANFGAPPPPPPSIRSSRRRRKRGKARDEAPHAHTGGSYRGMVDQVKRRLALLERLGYTKERELTPKGQFAKQIYGYEIQVTEFLADGMVSRLSEDQINVLFSAIVFESRKGDWFRPLAKDLLRPYKFKALKIVDDVRALEREFGIQTPTKELDYRMASVIWAWSRGCPFSELEAHSSLSDGDLVRYVRLAIQLERQTVRALTEYPHFVNDPFLAEKIKTAAVRMNRDVVDAEKQLRQG
ncbi:MAG: DEAD/DEAH box helicase [Planctomycetes bacterium]|nr:DEAD/DEAH box helicase [Planctomycetota bacterium]